MIRSLKILTQSSTLPMSLDAAKKHLRVDHSDDDEIISGYLLAAFDMIERRTGRSLRAITGTLFASEFPAGNEPICVPRPPLVSVTSITYTDTSGNSVTLSAGLYEVITSSVPGEIIPVNGQSWPVALDRRGSVRVTFAAGSIGQCPPTILDAVRLYIDYAYHEHTPLQSSRIQERIESLISGHRLRDSSLTGVFT